MIVAAVPVDGGDDIQGILSASKDFLSCHQFKFYAWPAYQVAGG